MIEIKINLTKRRIKAIISTEIITIETTKKIMRIYLPRK